MEGDTMEDWKKAWKPIMDLIEKDFSEGIEFWGADEVEKGAIRRFLEPLEFDCPLHYDKNIATEYGFENIIAPYSSLFTWIIPPYWEPGSILFSSDERNAQPVSSPVAKMDNPVANIDSDIAPHYFVTDLEIEYMNPVMVGERLCRIGNILKSCLLKETKAGRGAFMVWESKIMNQNKEVVAKVIMTTFNYQS